MSKIIVTRHQSLRIKNKSLSSTKYHASLKERRDDFVKQISRYMSSPPFQSFIEKFPHAIPRRIHSLFSKILNPSSPLDFEVHARTYSVIRWIILKSSSIIERRWFSSHRWFCPRISYTRISHPWIPHCGISRSRVSRISSRKASGWRARGCVSWSVVRTSPRVIRAGTTWYRVESGITTKVGIETWTKAGSGNAWTKRSRSWRLVALGRWSRFLSRVFGFIEIRARLNIVVCRFLRLGGWFRAFWSCAGCCRTCRRSSSGSGRGSGNRSGCRSSGRRRCLCGSISGCGGWTGGWSSRRWCWRWSGRWWCGRWLCGRWWCSWWRWCSRWWCSRICWRRSRCSRLTGGSLTIRITNFSLWPGYPVEIDRCWPA